MAERTKATVLKTVEPLAGSLGSNPSPSARDGSAVALLHRRVWIHSIPTLDSGPSGLTSIRFNRARWGTRGALNPKTSHAGLNSPPEGGSLSGQHRVVSMMKAGSCAAGRRELGQVRKEAALSGQSRVPQERLAGVDLPASADGPPFEGGVHGVWRRSTRRQR